ncbi:metal-dependent hydrolase [Candidatus Tachikawaea gelatinosa]|uniref:Membrane-bound metal-dependent hydrolase n=1 Tax=Candidatus Tachikawaea gelatinosa TaxID=1410383 RepID=A0A090BWF6_9ENTR|nr:metal-dependent hydrolase [Candidatus Tachikawaea gelatinosa]BAP58521.1 membrane-bound metal-dependent hydrolase [Candidatus Tachikawaea gelatinosa]
MTSNGHVFFSLATIIFVKRAELTKSIENADFWHLVFASFLTCLLPDIDHTQSFIGKKLKFLSKSISRIFGHRGFTHSLFCLLNIFILQKIITNLSIIPYDIGQGFFLGYLSHILADSFTPHGVKLFWPLKYRFRIPFLKNYKNYQSEKIFCILIISYVTWYPMKYSLYYHNRWLKFVIFFIKTKIFYLKYLITLYFST